VKRMRPRWLFSSLLFLDGVLAVSATLVGQSLTLGFDPIFYHPVLIAAAALVFMLIESYLPFLVLYKFIFEIILKRTRRVHPVALCWVIFVALNIVSVSVAVLSFGGHPDPIDIFIPVGLSIVNVAVFSWRRIWASGRGKLNLEREASAADPG
jgi:hypothetical protein